MAYKIYIDSSERYEKSVKLVEVLGNNQEKEVGKVFGDIDIPATIKSLLEDNNVSPKDIAEAVPVLGPGSFTGLKIGVTVANIINWVQGAKSIEDLDVPNYGSEPNIQITKKSIS